MHAAYWATWIAHKDDVRMVAERLGRPLLSDPDALEAGEAAAHLLGEGICTQAETLAFTRQAAELYASGPWVRDRPLERVFAYTGELEALAVGASASHPPALIPVDELVDILEEGVEGSPGVALSTARPVEIGQRRRILGRLMRGLDALRATKLYQGMSCDRRVGLLSSAGEGAGSFWTSVPTHVTQRFTSAEWSVAFQGKLGLLKAPRGTTCQLPSGRDPTEVCGVTMDEPCRHPSQCGAGPNTLRTHNALSEVVRQLAVREGAFADKEQRVPDLYHVDPTSGAVVEAILDVVISWPGSGIVHRVDVTVRCPYAARYAATSHSRSAVAADKGDEDKRVRYGDEVMPLTFESLGRLSAEGHATLAAISRESILYGKKRIGRRPGVQVKTLRARLEVELLRQQADTLLVSLGSRSLAALGWLPDTVFAAGLIGVSGVRAAAA